MKKISVFIVMVALVSGLWDVAFSTAAGEEVTLNILITDPHTSVIEAWRPKYEKETGVKINIIEVPYAALFDKMMMDFITRTGAYDLIVYPGGWAGDVMGGGWVLALDDYMKEYGYPDWGDVTLAIQQVVKWGGKVYAFPYDGDCHMLYYRKDALENAEYQAKFEEKFGYRYNIPPKSWEEVRDIAEFFNGWDWDNDGEINYGIIFIAKRKTQAMWSLMDIAAQYSVLPGGPDKYRGVFFFDPETMEPLVNTPGWVEGLKMIRELAKFAPPGLLGYGYSEARIAYVGGKAAIGIDWADIGIMEQYPEEYGSKVKGLLGYGPLPGASKVWDRKEGKWLYKYNHINFLDFGGWVVSIPKISKKSVEAYKFGAWFTAPERSIYDVCGLHGYTGANPWRRSHFLDVDKWVKAGWSRSSAQAYLGAIWKILTDPGALLDLRIPGTAKYYDYLDLYLAGVLAGEMDPEVASEKIYNSWVEITESYGKEEQLNLYRESLGLLPLK
jgi:multiple sugar transport system substrate-binding protein